MELAKIKLTVREGMTGTDMPVYLILKGSKKILIQEPALRQKREDLAEILDETIPAMDTGIVIFRGRGYSLVKGGFKKVVSRKAVVRPVPKTATRIYRVHPERLSEKQRRKICPPGLGGEARRQFIEDGLTFSEQVHRAKESNALRQAEWTKKERVKKTARRKANRERADYEEPEKEPRFEGVSVKEVAKRADLRPVEVRKFLRAKKIGKRGGRYAFTDKEADKVVRAVKKHYAERTA